MESAQPLQGVIKPACMSLGATAISACFIRCAFLVQAMTIHVTKSRRNLLLAFRVHLYETLLPTGRI
jgi:hypothetical protein